jgi:diguanylate cyclase (GGDEF)-like protein
MKRIIRSYLAAFGRAFTYDVRHNVYLWFGLLWGIPIPVMSIALDLSLGAATGRTPLTAVMDHPVHLIFLAHPLLFALVFGAMGTVRHALEQDNHRLIESLTGLATTDALTGLHNRRYVTEELEKAIQRSRRTDQRFAVALFDLDGFKQINDTRGHAAGDLVLKKASDALNSVVREGDVLGRYGGDEFLLITYGDLASASSLGVRADEAVQRATGLGTSAGISRFPEDGATPTLLLECADHLLAADKELRYARKGSTRRGSSARNPAVAGESAAPNAAKAP